MQGVIGIKYSSTYHDTVRVHTNSDFVCIQYLSIHKIIFCQDIQIYVHNPLHWTVSSDLYFNFSKFAHLQFWAKSNLSKINIAEVETIKDLGIISHNSTWERHYRMILSKAYKFFKQWNNCDQKKVIQYHLNVMLCTRE